MIVKCNVKPIAQSSTILIALFVGRCNGVYGWQNHTKDFINQLSTNSLFALSIWSIVISHTLR